MASVHANGWIFPRHREWPYRTLEPQKATREERLQRPPRFDGRRMGWLGASQPFELYTLRHTCLTRWAPHMDPWTLAYLAGHRDMNITKRYVHPQNTQSCMRWRKRGRRPVGILLGIPTGMKPRRPMQRRRN